MSNLSTSKIIGFFSLPSADLAEHNPSAYNAAMASLPHGAGTCSHCGMGIRHHVVIRDDNEEIRFIGTTCAHKVGIEPEALRYRMTSEQLAARKAERAAKHAEYQQKQQEAEDAHKAMVAARYEKVGDLVDMLRSLGGNFYLSLAEQLAVRPLSWRQAEYVAKATSATGRRNKRNAEAYDSVLDRCQA